MKFTIAFIFLFFGLVSSTKAQQQVQAEDELNVYWQPHVETYDSLDSL